MVKILVTLSVFKVFEKMVSGGYLGEIVRRVLLRMSEESALFGDTLPPKLLIPYILGYLLIKFCETLIQNYRSQCNAMQGQNHLVSFSLV